MGAGSAIEVRGLVKRFGAVEALAGVDLSVRPGELFTLLGPSGCGKTTLLRALAGFEPQDAGTISIGGRPLDGVPPHRRDIGMVFQSYAVFPHLTVQENVAFGLRARGRPDDEVARRVKAALERVRLVELAARTPDQLSGGQQQRVGLARALAIEPQVLLMDEPLSNLDAGLRVAMRDEVRALQQALGITTVYVTHDQEEALAVSDRIAVLRAGRIEQVGAPWEVYRRPATTFVGGFVGRMNLLSSAADAARAGLDARGAAQVGVRPEDVRVEARADGPGAIARRAFLGPRVAYAVDLGQGVTLEADGPRPATEADLLAVGARVAITVDPEALHRFVTDGRRTT